MRIFLNLLLAAILASAAAVGWLHTSKDAMDVIVKYFHWTPEGVALFEVLSVPILELNVALALIINPGAIVRGWIGAVLQAAGLPLPDFTAPTPKEIVDAAVKQAVSAGVEKKHVEDLRKENANALAEKISQMNPPAVEPMDLDDIKK